MISLSLSRFLYAQIIFKAKNLSIYYFVLLKLLLHEFYLPFQHTLKATNY